MSTQSLEEPNPQAYWSFRTVLCRKAATLWRHQSCSCFVPVSATE